MATGEISDAESLGGADMHSRVSGVSDQLAIDEYDGIRKARDWVANLNWEQKGNLPSRHLKGEYEEPYHSPGKQFFCVQIHVLLTPTLLEELLGIVSANIRIPFDATEVIIRLVDGSRFTVFKPNYGGNLVCGWAFIHGIPVGILANNNVIFNQEANKATQFIQLCNMKYVESIVTILITNIMIEIHP